MATLEMTIRNNPKGVLVVHQKFELSFELARDLIAAMEAMVADLPGSLHLSRTETARGVVVEITLNGASPPPVSPSFETLFRNCSEFRVQSSGL